jgi:hypothetical protein
MIEEKNIIRAARENFKTSFMDAVMKQTSSFHGTNDELMKQFA